MYSLDKTATSPSLYRPYEDFLKYSYTMLMCFLPREEKAQNQGRSCLASFLTQVIMPKDKGLGFFY